MNNHLVDFEKIEWTDIGEGIRFKKYESEGQVIRLMELTDEYADKDWCTHGHMAVIVEGEFRVKFEDHEECFKKGDTVRITNGESHKHIASVSQGKILRMISFEI